MLDYIKIKLDNATLYINENSIKNIRVTNPTRLTYLVVINYNNGTSTEIECTNMSKYTELCRELGIEE